MGMARHVKFVWFLVACKHAVNFHFRMLTIMNLVMFALQFDGGLIVISWHTHEKFSGEIAIFGTYCLGGV